MTHAPRQSTDHKSEVGAIGFTLPLVSVIVVNYNYGRYLAEAVGSVFAQTYGNIECVVVDNASTDDSLQVLDDLERKYPTLRVIRREANEGQCVATAEAFPETRGQFVVFLDADDVLLPEFVGAHLYVHLSLYTHVGFTCSDMIQTVDREVVLSTFHSVKELVVKRKDHAGRMLRPLEPSICATDGLVPVAEDDVLPVARDERGWPWAATSAFLFRRDALAILMENPRLRKLQTALDVYFGRGINVITGSVVINRPLAVYRMHGSNVFSNHAHLERCFNFDRTKQSNQNERARRELIDFWFANSRVLIDKLLVRDDFIEAVRTLDITYPRLFVEESRRSYAADRLLANFSQLRALVGLPAVLAWCLRLRVSPLALVSRRRAVAGS